MKLLARIALPVIFLAVLIALIYRAKSKHEPEFQGEPLSVWLVTLIHDTPRIDSNAVIALRTMGEPAVRHLTEMVENENSILTKLLLKRSHNSPFLAQFVHNKSWNRQLAAQALGEIGTNAAAAIHALEKMSRDSSKAVASAAIGALILIRNEPVENYVAAYLDYPNNRSNGAYGIRALMSLGPHAKVAVPVLLQQLNSTNSALRRSAITLLGYIGVECSQCVNALTNFLKDPDPMVRHSAVSSLALLGTLAKPAAAAVAELLDDPDALCQGEALFYFEMVLTPEEFAPYRAHVERLTNAPNETTAALAANLLREKARETPTERAPVKN